MLPGTLASEDSPVIVEKSDTDIQDIRAGTNVTEIAEDGGALGDGFGIRPVDHGDSSFGSGEYEGCRVLATAEGGAVAGTE